MSIEQLESLERRELELHNELEARGNNLDEITLMAILKEMDEVNYKINNLLLAHP